MHIKDHSAAMKFFRTYDNVASKGKWKDFVDEMEFESMIQKPRITAQEPRIGLAGGQLVQPNVDGSRPGYKGPKGGLFSADEYKAIAAEYDTVLQEAFDNRTLKNIPEFKEWAITNHGEAFNKKHHRKAVTKLSKLQFDTTRNKLLDTLINEANDGFKLVELETLQKQAGFVGETKFPRGKDIYGKLDKATDKMKKGFDYLFMDSNKPAIEMFDSMTQLKRLTGIEAAPSKFLRGYVPYEESKGLIQRLSIPLSKQRLSKVPELTLGELQFRIDNKIVDEKIFSPPRTVTNETKILDIVKRHVDQGGTEIKWIQAPTKTGLGYPGYSEAKFKFKGQDKVYDMAELIRNAETDPNFKEFFKVQDDLKKLNSKEVIHPKTGKKIRFDKLMQEVYGYRTPYVMDHFGQVGKNPFSKLRVLPTRINAAASSLYLFDEKFITDPAKQGKYSIKGKKQALDKIGYNYQRNADDLFKAEFKLAEDVLKRGRVLRTPHQIVDSIREVKAASVIPKAKKVPFSYPLSSGAAAGFDDLLKGPGAKKIGAIARKTLLSDWVWPEIALGGAEYINRLQKGQTDRAGGETLKMMSLGFYDSGATEEAVLNQAKKLGYDEKDMRALENFMRYNKIGQEIKGAEQTIAAMELGAAEQGSEEGVQTMKEKIENLKKTQDSVAGFYFGAIGDKKTTHGVDLFETATSALAEEEFQATIDDRLGRRDPYAGGIGNWLQNNIFTLHSRERRAEQQRIDAMSDEEKRQRGIDMGLIPRGPLYGAHDPKKFEDLEESLGYMFSGAEGGIASLKKW